VKHTEQTGLYTQGIVNDNGEMAECNDQWWGTAECNDKTRIVGIV